MPDPLIMKRLLSVGLAGLLCASAVQAREHVVSAPPAAAKQVPAAPDVTMPALFQAVQHARVFDDQKTFPDLQPLQAPAEIEAAYLAQRGTPGFDLRAFVQAHFRATPLPATPALPADAPITRHIDALWPLLSRDSRHVPPHGSQLSLPRHYVVPGGRFGEMYYWDSYFTMVGLHASGEGARARDMLVDSPT